jgi:hypothetical protein
VSERERFALDALGRKVVRLSETPVSRFLSDGEPERNSGAPARKTGGDARLGSRTVTI